MQHSTGLILAGGAGRRVAQSDKGLLRWQGQPLAAHVATRLRPQVNRLIISCNRNRAFYATLAEDTVTDTRRDYQGPLAGLEAAIPLIDGEFVVVVPCDTPLLPLDLAQRLLAPMAATGDRAVDISYAHDGGRGHYLCAAIRTAILPTVTAYLEEGQRAVRHWYAQHRVAVIDFSDEKQCFANYNRAE